MGCCILGKGVVGQPVPPSRGGWSDKPSPRPGGVVGQPVPPVPERPGGRGDGLERSTDLLKTIAPLFPCKIYIKT